MFSVPCHDLNHVTEISTRIIVLEKGLVIKDEKVDEQTLAELNEYFTNTGTAGQQL